MSAHGPATQHPLVELAGEGLGSEPSDSDEADPRTPLWSALPWFVSGDIDAFTGVFSNNLATVLAGAQMLSGILPNDLIYERILPGVGVSMAFGCAWYVVQALLKAQKSGRKDLCCIPFGVNTPGLFAFNSGIIMSVYFAEGQNAEAGRLAWKVGVVANFVQGMVEILLAPFGPYISRTVPMVALLGSLASVGLAWLFANTLQTEAAWPAVTIPPFFLLISAVYADVKVPRLPSTLLPVVLGGILAWGSRKASWEDVEKATSTIGFHLAVPSLEPFEDPGKVLAYLGIAVPVALTVAIGTIQVRQMAENAGDNYNLRWSMFGDGLATVIASLFGSPWGMTVFLGHGAFKSMGAKIGYSIGCGLAFILVSFSGIAALLLAFLPAQVLNPIILFVGLAVCIEGLEITSAQHWPALLIALVPGFFNWAAESCAAFADAVCSQGFRLANGSVVSGGECAVSPRGIDAWHLSPMLEGLRAIGDGYLLISIFWASMTIFLIDRKFGTAAMWAAISAASASCGLVHSDVVFLPWEGPGHKSLHWDFALAYALTCVLFVVISLMQRLGHSARERIHDGKSFSPISDPALE